MAQGITLGIVGSRHFDDYQIFKAIINKFCSDLEVDRIVSGGASGADSLARRYAIENKIKLVEHLPDWHKHGRAAGPIRNTLIIAESDILLALVAKDSVGTLDSIRKAGLKGIRVIRVNV